MATNEKLSVRRLPFYLFLFLLGFLAFYVFDYMTKNPGTGNGYSPIESGAEKIDEKIAREYLNNYLIAQDSLGEAYKISTSGGKTLRGFWLSKKTLDEIDESIRKSGEKRDIVGYSIYFGKPETFARNSRQDINLVVRGTVPRKEGGGDAAKMMRVAEEEAPIEDAGDYFDTIDPCPIHCGSPSPEEP